MSRIVEWFRERLLGPDEREDGPPPRLDRERVLQIARAAAAADPRAAELEMTDLQTRGGAKIWVVSTFGLGQWLAVEIDDATEAVLSVGRYGLR
jgi:hypothetical protein